MSARVPTPPWRNRAATLYANVYNRCTALGYYDPAGTAWAIAQHFERNQKRRAQVQP